MTKSLTKFPTRKLAAFDPDSYGVDVRQQVAKASPYEGDVGLEIELEGTGLPATIDLNVNGVTWVSHNDGSLRGGIEYVTSAPCAAADVDVLVSGLFAAIRAAGGVIRNSTRCSTHVHVNARGMKLNQIAAFVALYGCFETTLTNWCEPIRRGNLFALRFEDCDYAVDGWAECFKSGSFEWSNDLRYLALNPAALMKFGSLEVRTLGAIETAEPLVKWVEALLRLRKLATSAEYADPSTIASDLSSLSGRGFFDKVFSNLAIGPELLAASTAYDVEFDVRNGYRRVQPILYSVAWAHALPEITKVFIPNPFGQPKKRKKKSLEDYARELGTTARAMPPLRFAEAEQREDDDD